ncbi:type II toxin-antitoxin system VapC family toxin [Emcibacter sp. SYSU 3D8]|uniref:type II toxin-antitoxin system VapC family toxin n=1 Tax=Emcibacter sp. SYSU 3D8 TaxID=3133969 RepID=UPI0031FEFF0C
MIVVDASALIEAFLRRPAGLAVERRIFRPGETLHAPHLVDVEVAHVIRRYAAVGEIDDQQARAILAAMADFPLTRHRHDVLLERIWELRHNVSAYDGAYVALAEILGAPLLTSDQRLAASSGHQARIDLA